MFQTLKEATKESQHGRTRSSAGQLASSHGVRHRQGVELGDGAGGGQLNAGVAHGDGGPAGGTRSSSVAAPLPTGLP